MSVFKSLFLGLSQIGVFWQKSYNRKLFISSVLLITLQTACIFYFYDRLPPETPLFYSHPWGNDQLVSSSYLFLLPITSFLILLFNIFLTLFFAKLKLLSISLLITSTLYSLLSFITLIKIINLVI